MLPDWRRISRIESLLDPDGASRQANVACARRILIPVTTMLVVDALIARLAHRNECFGRVVSTLSQFGDAALASLLQRFQETRSTVLQHGIIETLTTMAAIIDSEQRSAVLGEAMYLPRFAADHSVRERVGALIELLARAGQAPGKKRWGSEAGGAAGAGQCVQGLSRPSAIPGDAPGGFAHKLNPQCEA
jgi:hypothetical protein